MTRSSHHLLTAALALVLAAVPCAAVAQEVVQAIPGTTDADKLGDLMRRVASNPRDVDALIRAGDLSMGLGDLSGAAALFARAEKVNPRDGRIKAGMGSILVRSERPGEALRYYGQAESLGLDPRNFAADRALAYDLIGQQDRAQRDYRVALRNAPDDETLRRYALSLGISGKQDLAVQQLGPLLLKSDRGAWRARAFILAMNGDVAGAEKIATAMMPRGTAQGLQPFFQRLPNLPASDRAFAVHFGEVHATPARLADARMTPPLGVLAPDPTAPVMMAAVPQPVAVAASGKTKHGRRGKPGRTEMAATTTRATAPVPVVATRTPTAPAPTTPAPTTPAAVAPPVQLASSALPMVQAVPAQSTGARVATPQPTYRAPQVAQTTTAAPQVQAPVAVRRVAPTPTSTGTSPATTAAQMAALPAGRIQSESNTRVANSVAAAAVASTGTTAQPVTPGPVQSAPVQQAAVQSQPMTPAPVASVQQPVQQASAAPLPTPGFSANGASSTATPTSRPVEVAAAMPPRAVAASEDSILARIVAGLSIPASELDVAPMRPAPVVTQAAVPVSDDAERVLAEAKAKLQRDATAKKIAAEQLAADKKAALDKKAAARKAIADKKALAEKKAAAAEKLAADKAAAEEKRIARANPERIWVQVSTGATEGDLPKAWRGVKAKAPAVFGSRGGWTTPWKATNRVLAGPFKTDAEARTFVNQLAKEGVSTFSFTSDPGQVITKLPAK
ncbi:SPOR domain-containing protein [Sphingomonas sp. UV9]|uniref:SPOR domain-containing protein n=1 Tax=Sphingomonas sp. UV9 TaxID=1851410 RepID=UPI000FFB50CB|nr:SPOR domain-containing protein [Sphingomonas sp. UV9]RXD07537.1 SPOR domain-containing protein [Sphingomonas sp. UV9]